MRRKTSLFVVLLLALTALACNITASQVSGTVTATSLPPVDTPAPEATVTPAPGGVISGRVNYPSEFIPAQRVVAFSAEDLSVYYVAETAANEPDFAISLPAGKYYLVSYVLDGGLAGGYTQAVPCGLLASCEDHSLIPIEVAPGKTVSDIHPFDWYASPDAFPPMP